MAWPADLSPPIDAPPDNVAKAKSLWPAEARALARKLLRTEALTALGDGLRIDLEEKTFSIGQNVAPIQSRMLALFSPSSWLARVEADNAPTLVGWCDSKERGVYSRTFQLGRVRAACKGDLCPFRMDWCSGSPASENDLPEDVGVGTIRPLEEEFAGYSARIKPQEKGRTLLVLTPDQGPDETETSILVDTDRDVVLSETVATPSGITSTTSQGDFVRVDGVWWPSRIERTDELGRQTTLTTQKFTALGPGELERLWKNELADRDQVQFVHEPLPTVAHAQRASAAGRATLEDEIVLVSHFQATEQWDRSMEHLEKAERLSNKPGMRWIRMELLAIGRCAEEFKQRCFAEAESLAKQPRAAADQLVMAQYLLGCNNNTIVNPAMGTRGAELLDSRETLALLNVLRPVFERQSPRLEAMREWSQQRINNLEQVKEPEEILPLRKELAEKYPRDCEIQCEYARALVAADKHEAARAWLDAAMASGTRWDPWEEAALRNTYADVLEAQGREAELIEYLAAWCKRTAAQGPISSSVSARRPLSLPVRSCPVRARSCHSFRCLPVSLPVSARRL